MSVQFLASTLTPLLGIALCKSYDYYYLNIITHTFIITNVYAVLLIVHYHRLVIGMQLH